MSVKTLFGLFYVLLVTLMTSDAALCASVWDEERLLAIGCKKKAELT